MLNKCENYKKVKRLMRKLWVFDIKNLDWNIQTKDDCSLFEEAVYAGFNEEDLLLILNYALEQGMDINKRTSMYGDTYMHALIECDDYHGNLAPFLYLGYLNNFNPNLRNHSGKNVWDALQKPDTIKMIDPSDKELCFKIKKLYELKKKKEKLTKIKEEIAMLQQEEKELSKFVDNNKSLTYDIEKNLNLKK